MFTIFNFLNYFAGKPVNVYVLFALTIGVYFYLIKYHFDTIYDNYIYTIILLILLILDLISIVLLFFYNNKSSNDSDDSDSIVKIHSSEEILIIPETNEEKKTKKKSRKNKDIQSINEPKKENSYPLDDINKDIISLFDINKEPSLHTY